MSLSCLVDAAREKSVDHSSGATIVSSVAPLLRCTLELYAWGSSAAMMQLQQVHSACHERSRLRQRQPSLQHLPADKSLDRKSVVWGKLVQRGWRRRLREKKDRTVR